LQKNLKWTNLTKISTIMNIPYNIEVHDNLVSPVLQSKIWDYIRLQEWYVSWHSLPEKILKYRPEQGNGWFPLYQARRTASMHRCPLASDIESLKPHLPIYLLWKEINKALGDQFELTGNPEGIICDNEAAPGGPISTPVPKDPDLKTGWRAYVNGIYSSDIHGNGYVHRDTFDLDDPNTVTMLYVVNKEWYPSWGAELKYYPEDPTGSTGDHQQFNGYRWQQKRDFKIGWLDYGRIVSPVPGRLIIADGRCMHSTSSSKTEIPSYKVCFRARRKLPA
jgi:hypothetical protein